MAKLTSLVIILLGFLILEDSSENVELLVMATSGLTVGPWIGLRDTTGSLTYKWVQPGVRTTQTFFTAGALLVNGCTFYDFLTGPPPPPPTSWLTGFHGSLKFKDKCQNVYSLNVQAVASKLYYVYACLITSGT
ncbi:hypothetical protein B566_EDAN017075 [Ephemera danica]|nr:hypothetical protein B566_EDAN017075 [Ephemera danica]